MAKIKRAKNFQRRAIVCARMRNCVITVLNLSLAQDPCRIAKSSQVTLAVFYNTAQSSTSHARALCSIDPLSG